MHGLLTVATATNYNLRLRMLPDPYKTSLLLPHIVLNHVMKEERIQRKGFGVMSL